MVMDLLYVFVFFVQMLISAVFFNNIFEKKKSMLFIILFGIILFEIGAIINNYIISAVWVDFIFLFIVNFVFAAICFKIQKLRAGFYSLLLVVISTIIEMIVVFAISPLMLLYISKSNSDTVLLVVEIVVSKIFYFLIAMILVKFTHKDDNKIRIPLAFYVFPITAAVSVICFWYISLNEFMEYKNQIILAFVSILLFIATIFIFFAYQANARKENKILMLQQEQDKIQTDISYYEILEKQNDDLRVYAHDAKNHLATIKEINSDPQIDSYISKMLENLEEYSSVCRSGNKILDVMINKYLAESSLNDITFEYDVKNNNLTELQSYDMVGILGNLLDNAIEAASESKEKYITFETDFRNNYSVIIITNSCDSSPHFDDNRTIMTTKKNKTLHGWGLKSVKKTIKKYDGDISLDYDDGANQFIVTIMLSKDKNRIKHK